MLVKPQLLLLAASFAGLAAAQGTAKIGIINIQAAIANTEDGKKAIQALETKIAPKRKEIEKRQAEIQAKQAQLQKGGAVLAEDQKRRLMSDIDSMTKVFNRDVEDASQELEQEQQKVLQEIGQKMQVVIDKHAKEKGFALILDVSSPQTPVLYAAAETDVTREIVDAYNKTAGTAAPAKPAATTPPPAAPPAAPSTPPATKKK